MRSGDSIEIANTKERLAIQDVKSFRYAESMKVEPTVFGGLIGAFVASSVANAYSAKDKHPASQRTTIALLYAILGGALGAMSGNSYKSILRFRMDVRTVPKPWRVPYFTSIMSLTAGAVFLIQRLLRQLLGRMGRW